MAASTKLAHVVHLKTNGSSKGAGAVSGTGTGTGTATVGDIKSAEIIAAPSAVMLPDSEIDANDDVSVSVLTVRCGPEPIQTQPQPKTKSSKVPPAIYPK